MNKDERDIPSAPEIGGTKHTDQPVPQLIHSQSMVQTPVKKIEPEFDEQIEVDEAGRQYDPNRGDFVEHLKDTTIPPKPATIPRFKKRRRWLVPLVIVLLLVGAGAGVYAFLGNKKTATPEKAAVPTTQEAAPKAADVAEPKTPATEASSTTKKQYTSTTYSMSLAYPSNWKLTDEATGLHVVSPLTNLTTASGSKTTGYVRVTVQPRQTTLPDFAKGSATAVLASERLAYTKPTQLQRTQTYLTFASYQGTTNNGWDAVHITGDNGYQIAQTIPQSDILQTDPLVTIRFLSCKDQACSGTVTPLSLQASEWKNSAISAPIKTIIESFSFN